MGANALTTARHLPQADAMRATAAKARAKRKLIAEQAGVIELAQDTALSIGARSSVEEMLADQMAAAHNAGMRLLTQASILGRVNGMVNLTNAAARMMEVFQGAAITLHRMRTGGRQVVTVQHVTVSDGGNAVVAGAITPANGQREEGESGSDGPNDACSRSERSVRTGPGCRGCGK